VGADGEDGGVRPGRGLRVGVDDVNGGLQSPQVGRLIKKIQGSDRRQAHPTSFIFRSLLQIQD